MGADKKELKKDDLLRRLFGVTEEEAERILSEFYPGEKVEAKVDKDGNLIAFVGRRCITIETGTLNAGV